MIHPLAEVAMDTQIGRGTKVWQFASVIRGARIGENCGVAACAIIDGATVGDGCLIGHGASVHPGSMVGNGVFIGPCAVLANDRWPSASKDGFEFPEGERYTVIVEDGAAICAHAVVLPGVRIGAGSVVAAHATVTRDVPPEMVWTRHGDLTPKPKDWRLRRMRWAA